MNHYQIIKKLEENNSRLYKEKIILSEMERKNVVLFEGFNYAYDKLKTFGVKQIPSSKNDGLGLSWCEFKLLLDKLRERKITGHTARDHILEKMNKSKKDDWNYFFRRILIKDFRCGVSEKTINNVAKKNNFNHFLIPVFSCQLAQDSEQHQKKLMGKKILEVKLDGVRVLCILYKSGEVDMFSRNGKELNNFSNIKQQFENITKKISLEEDTVLDGEITSKNFQELMTQIYRKDNVQNDDAEYYLFDTLSLKDFKSGISKNTQTDRAKELKHFFDKYLSNFKNIKLVERLFIDLDTNDGKKKFKDFNANTVKEGFEGIMIKNPDAYYECKRSSAWLKSKPVLEISLEVVNVEEGTGRNKGKLGALHVQGKDQEKFFKVHVGSGFSDAQRISFWKQKESLIGQIVEVKADMITKSKEGKFWSLRFPRFKNFRGFQTKEKI